MKSLIQLVLFVGFASLFVFLFKKSYDIGFLRGHNAAIIETQADIDNIIALARSGAISYKKDPVKTTPYVKPTLVPEVRPSTTKWNGPQLWEVVNKRRISLGVNSLSQRDELCTIASIRLNQLLELKKLDGHEGFGKLPKEREDLAWIFDKYNISEFLLSGAKSPEEAVLMWENTLGHKKLLTGGEYVWGCVYAQDTYAVAITAY